jgi:hypothetical protein
LSALRKNCGDEDRIGRTTAAKRELIDTSKISAACSAALAASSTSGDVGKSLAPDCRNKPRWKRSVVRATRPPVEQKKLFRALWRWRVGSRGWGLCSRNEDERGTRVTNGSGHRLADAVPVMDGRRAVNG